MSTWLNPTHPIGLVNRDVGITGWFTSITITFLFTASSANVSRNQY